MKEKNNSRSKFPNLLLAVIFIAVLAAGIVFQDWLEEQLLVPMLYLFWVAELAFKSFSQFTLWHLTLILAVILSFIYAVGREKNAARQTRPAAQRPQPTRGRILFWGHQIQIVKYSNYAARYRFHELTQLIIKTLMYREKSSRKEILAQVRSGELDLPPEVRAIVLRKEPGKVPIPRVGLFRRIQRRLSGQSQAKDNPKRKPDRRLEEVASYLENITEGSNGF